MTWREMAACRGMDPSIFFPATGGNVHGPALAVCARCTVRANCLNYAMDHREDDGVWGGTEGAERVRERRRRDRNKPTLTERALVEIQRRPGTLDEIGRRVGSSRWTVRDAVAQAVRDGRIVLRRPAKNEPAIYEWVDTKDRAS